MEIRQNMQWKKDHSFAHNTVHILPNIINDHELTTYSLDIHVSMNIEDIDLTIKALEKYKTFIK